MSCLCFCRTPTVTSPKLHGQSRSESTAAKKLHSMASAWENFCEIITCGRRTLTFPWERLSLDPSPTLRSTLRVFLLLFTVHRCCALHHDGDRLQLAAAPVRRDHRPIQCVFQHQLTYGILEKKARASMGQGQAYTGCPFRAGPGHLSVTSGGIMQAR